MSKETPQILKGFRDYLPQEQAARRKVMAKISEVFERFGFAPMDTPALEPYDLLKGSIGEDEKLIYKFEDLGGRQVALRYDLTVPLSRVVAIYPELPKPLKRYQIANVFRAENPQRGRFREFTQCDVDIIGSDSNVADAEVIAAISDAFKNLEVGEVVLKFNNRQIVDKVLSGMKFGKDDVVTFLRLIDKLDKVGEQKVIELLEEAGLDVRLDEFRTKMTELGQPWAAEFMSLLSGFGVENLEFEPFLARGLSYYTGTIFEFILRGKPEFGSIAGGGRYDNLIGKLSGKPLPAVGGSIGLDRLLAALSGSGKIAPQTAAEVVVFNLDEKLMPEYLNIATNLRNAGIDTELYYEAAKLDKQFKYAESKNIQVAVIVGADELEKRQANLKNLNEKTQITVDLDNLATEIKSQLW
ncbi:MAG TPA: histidine--tRNA ligase [Patescibacteria group bacterium]|nr:histidine--tRNA ligase [Patescibacteria group bacterium]